ncbi:MAG TPA: NAD(P)-dependent oxidoreductase [Solirubrobacteraceae bacterium]|jgi:malate dehydrogenase (oxaloacetate-decarboxylating)|nr:NAD(P)-dependent oxidoreductase [Solirubrobacteraceae bacterium]
MLDCTYRIQIPHRPGQLSRVCGAIAEGEGLIGDIVTIAVTREASIREITVEVRDQDQAERISELLLGLDGVSVVWHRDRALIRHEGGKLTIDSTREVRSVQDMRDVYTPGVARVCRAIAADPALATRYTMIGRTVGILTNGTRVLGLGDIGPRAAMPVMEGKAVFYRQCVGLSAMPILLDTRDPDEFVQAALTIAPTFGAIHLEDISAPECFEIEARLQSVLPQPVMHDDVHGTAVVTLAAMLAACRTVGRDPREMTVGQLGLGAAGLGIASLMVQGGARRVLAFDPSEGSHGRARERGIEVASMEDVLAAADVVVATTGRPGLITADMIRPGQVILALTNPDPEIAPADALAAGAAFAADGSMVNNVLGYPGLFRGALEAEASEITLAMKLAAAEAIAELTAESELVPDPLDPGVHRQVADAVRRAARPYEAAVAAI